ncbi:hypothetical protein M1L60_19930 [Actinoplanes sp. TRM 88003]|uniref:Uncharacterized protein n=1 Tax=Paractinoplanes aksuensis TaxID=2939490 RepID=A0ABT1DPU5_9ACTN|nr:hypothetical protein [Actinoplanes aksuensis]MCO8272868.1 hypothetical protein [Actinoplanes aksuensis]
MSVTPATEMRRWVGKFVLFLAFVWVVVLIAGIAGAFQGAEFPLLNVLVALIPGCAFVPASYFSLQLHRTDDKAVLDRIWPKALVYGIAGMVLLIGGAYGLYEMGRA